MDGLAESGGQEGCSFLVWRSRAELARRWVMVERNVLHGVCRIAVRNMPVDERNMIDFFSEKIEDGGVHWFGLGHVSSIYGGDKIDWN